MGYALVGAVPCDSAQRVVIRLRRKCCVNGIMSSSAVLRQCGLSGVMLQGYSSCKGRCALSRVCCPELVPCKDVFLVTTLGDAWLQVKVV